MYHSKRALWKAGHKYIMFFSSTGQCLSLWKIKFTVVLHCHLEKKMSYQLGVPACWQGIRSWHFCCFGVSPSALWIDSLHACDLANKRCYMYLGNAETKNNIQTCNVMLSVGMTTSSYEQRDSVVGLR